MAINLIKLIRKLKTEERYVGAILFGPAYCGKTWYLKRVISQNKDQRILYIDSQNYFERHNNPESLLTTRPKSYIEQIQKYSVESDIEHEAIIIDHSDALYNIWSNQKQEEFIKMMLRVEKSAFKLPLVWVLQGDERLENLYSDQHSNTLKKIIKFNELEAI
ncbi:MAG: hypothetical protein IH852_04915 [Bacteroidetes bacterium]|nr:hypothetical protein [Bacteroidota bacterium]